MLSFLIFSAPLHVLQLAVMKVLNLVVVLAAAFALWCGMAAVNPYKVTAVCGPTVSTPIALRTLDTTAKVAKQFRKLALNQWNSDTTYEFVMNGIRLMMMVQNVADANLNGDLEHSAVTGYRIQTQKAMEAALANCCPTGASNETQPPAPAPETPWDPKNASLQGRGRLSGADLAFDALDRAGFPAREIPMFVAIAKLESGFDPDPPHPPVVDGYAMHGMWQLNSRYWKLVDWRNPYANAVMAKKVRDESVKAGNGPYYPWSTRHAAAKIVGQYADIGGSAPDDPVPTGPSVTVRPCSENPTTPGDTAGALPAVTPTVGTRTVRWAGRDFQVPIPEGKAGVAIEFAIKQLGDKYVWGAHGPDAWDCSGLTAGAWKAAGVTITPQSGAQNRQLKHVPVSQMRPGDILWHPGHVQLYIGIIDGKRAVIEAPNPRRPVRIDTSGWMKVESVLRPIGDAA